ncbi:hypothetical protein BGW36DRAFT_428396 [Talaromyces proteolyticus]|uniref:Nucleic-acid-binding protein from mobile element jockey n=1 Tax=Talaromyces proteolyticus TaxID=1131652 RepID=A0AAD4PXH1_9EURO|nr:uncharacterized protein BGW36DRAFT_428396 [Talaromyces proteolyticus]KAH8696379.1 hypothetical protein BGW36DRAFT_428396 [Talaromyces proteolyticus]
MSIFGMAAKYSDSEPSWVQGWNGKLPSQFSSVLSNSLSTGSSPLTPFPAQEDLEVFLEHTDTDLINPLRRHPYQIVNKANQAVQSTRDATIAHRRFAAVRVLASGDLALLATASRNAAGIRLKSENAPIFKSLPAPMNITHVGWLPHERKIREQGPETSFLVVMFDDERVANFAINRGLITKGKQHACQIYDKTVNLQQCFKCQMYKHIAKFCRRQLRCAYCAGEHGSGDCPVKNDRDHAKCVNCTEENLHIKDPAKKLDTKHFAYARDCLIRAHCLTQVHQHRTFGPQFHAPCGETRNGLPRSSQSQ